jgi:hypothetical protein|tara:strand:- start:154 stop:780 length:627 start_codon:yes stop_codon:yes gene_type:complete
VDNNLNFDREKYFGLGLSATKIVLDNSSGGASVLYRVFDASGMNTALNVQPTAQKPTTEFALSTISNADALASTTIQYPIKVVRMLYSCTKGQFFKQLNNATFEWTRANLDGTVRRGADIQSGLEQKNWMYTNISEGENALVQIEGEFTIDQNTAMYLEVEKGTIAQVILVLDTSSYKMPDESEIKNSEYNGWMQNGESKDFLKNEKA